MAPLCREHHDALHAKKFRLMINGDFVSTVTPDGHIQTERALVVNDQAEDSRYWSDEHLAWRIGQALEHSALMIWEVMRCAAEWQRRYGYGEGWAERLAQFVRDQTGQTRGYSVRNLEYWAKEWPHYKDHRDDWILQSGRISHRVATDADPDEARQIATVSLLAGKPRLAVVDDLRERQGKQPTAWCICSACGHRHARKSQ